MQQNNLFSNEAIIANKNDRKTFSDLGFGYFLFALIALIVQLIVGIVVTKYFSSLTEHSFYGFGLSFVSFYVIAFPIAFLWLRKIKSEKIKQNKLTFGQFISTLFICFPIMYAANILGVIINFAISLLKGSTVTNPLQYSISSSGIIWTFIYAVLIAPIAEELIFRKLLISKTIRYGEFISVFLSALFFGLFHGNSYQIFYAFVLGGIFAYTYVKTGKVIYTVIMHMIINLCGTVASAVLLNLIDLDSIINFSNINPNDTELIMSSLKDILPSLIILVVLFIFVFAVNLTGVIILIVRLAKRKKPEFKTGSIVIPKGKAIKTVFLNAGMVLFILICMVEIVINLF